MLVRIQLILVYFFFATGFASAEPTEEREWKSTAGTTIRAVATGVADGKVSLKSADGRVIPVPLDKLIEADRTFLEAHFEMASEPAGGGSGAEAASGLRHPLGEAVGPVDAGGETQYLVYLPTSLKSGRKAPLLFFTAAGGGSKAYLMRMAEGAEINGWIVSISLNSRNGQDWNVNHKHSKISVEHMIASLPVDEDRIYFSGGSGGGAMSLYNASKIKHAGTITIIGYMPDGAKVSGGDYVFINGATDYNRHTSAHARSLVGRSTIHLFHPGAHNPGLPWMTTDAITWLNGRYLSDEGKDLKDERLDYEASVIGWIGELKESEPWRAYYFANYLLEDYKAGPENAGAIEALRAELGADDKNRRYAEGIAALDEFGREHLEGHGGGSRYGYTNPGIEKAAAELVERFAGVPHIEETAKALGEPTIKRGGKK